LIPLTKPGPLHCEGFLLVPAFDQFFSPVTPWLCQVPKA